MISKDILIKAEQKDIITREQVEPLYQFLSNVDESEKHDAVAYEDDEGQNREEPLKFIRSFGDVFISLGVLLLAISVNMANLTGLYLIAPVLGFIAISEWLVRVRRLALPGIVILLSILFFVNEAIGAHIDAAVFIKTGLIGLTSLLFYLRYKMPFSLLPLAASVVAMVIMQLGFDVLQNPVIFVVMGLLVFAVAMWFDSRDTKRVSHLSDSAFWLHLLASPLLVHGVMVSMFFSDQAWVNALSKEVIVLSFFVLFFFLALLVDRRAMLISTQIYVIYALTNFLQGSLDSSQNVLMFVLIVLGLFVIFFGTYWYKARSLIFGFLSGSVISKYLPDFAIKDAR